MESLVEAVLRWPLPGTAIWVAVLTTSLVIAIVSAHALGMARGRRTERLLEATRSSLEAAVHGVPDRRRRGLSTPDLGRPAARGATRGSVCSMIATNDLLSSREVA